MTTLPAVTRALPALVVDLAAFRAAASRPGCFLDAEGHGEIAAAAAVRLPGDALLRHAPPLGAPVAGRWVVGDAARVRALERVGRVCEPTGVVLRLTVSGHGDARGFDPFRGAFAEVLRHVAASPRLTPAGIYLTSQDDATPGAAAAALRRTCRAGVELAAALQDLSGTELPVLFVRRRGPLDRPLPAAEAAALPHEARDEVARHVRALGARPMQVLVDAGPESWPACHEARIPVMATAADTITLDLPADEVAVLAAAVAASGDVITVRPPRPGASPVLVEASVPVRRRLAARDGRTAAEGVALPASVRPGDVLRFPLPGRVGLAAAGHSRLVGVDAASGRTRELLSGLPGRPPSPLAHRPAG